MSLKQTGNRVNIEGWLNSKEYEIKVDRKDKEFISGTINIKVAEENIIPVEVFSYAKKKDGGDNVVFKGLQTVFNDTVAANETDDPNEVTKIRITAGEIRINDFANANNEIISAVKYNTNFINRVNDNTFEPKAKFDVEMIVQKFRPEVKDDEETGAGYVDGFIVDYSGNVKPLTLKAPKGVYEKLEGTVEKGNVINFWGDIVNSVETKTIVIEADFGEDQERVVTNSRRERLIVGAKYSDKEFEKKDIKEAFEQREKYLQSLIDKKRGTFTGGNTEVEDDDELPF